jgi:hypothetical protein
MGVQEIRWDRGGTNPAGEFFHRKGYENHELGTTKRIMLAFKRV